MVTPDNFIVSLDAKTGKERWNKEFAPTSASSTSRPSRRSSIGNHVSSAPATTSTRPATSSPSIPTPARCSGVLHRADERRRPGRSTRWPSLQAARYGGGHPWLPGVYDPETNLYIFGTGNPIPAYTLGRGEGDNLFTCSLIAINVDDRQDGVVLPDLAARHARLGLGADAGAVRRRRSTARSASWCRPRRATATSSRSTASPASTSSSTKYGSATNWAASVDAKGSVRREPTKDPPVAGALTSPTSGGTINWEPPAYSPDTGLFYVSERNGHSIYYLTDPDPRGSMGLAGKEEVFVGNTGNFLTAIDPLTGKIAWRRPYPAAGGRACTAAAAPAC